MTQDPKALDRPLVVLGGYRAPYTLVGMMSGRLTRMTSGVRADALGIAFMLEGSIEAAADRAVAKIDERWPGEDPEWTVEVDVVGISMGGLVARYAWAVGERSDGTPRKKLRIARLFTIATPHRGATLADSIAPDRAARQMRAGSELLGVLDRADGSRDFEMVCYARTRDAMVGATRSAPPGEHPHWLHGPLLFGHLTVARDWRIAVDIARRLRGDEPLALESSTPPRD